MAITLTYQSIKDQFIPRYWESIDEFEEYYIQDLLESDIGRIYYTDKNGVEKILDGINHYPELKEYEVWMGGYSATGQSAGAMLWGKAFARNFSEACHKVACQEYLKNTAKYEKDPSTQHSIGRWDYDPKRKTYWGCGLYWDEKIARKTFG